MLIKKYALSLQQANNIKHPEAEFGHLHVRADSLNWTNLF
jgi:hypothetical protein